MTPQHTDMPTQTPQIMVPDEDVFLRSVHALYQEIDQLREVMQWQSEQMKAMAVELLLLGRWKPIDNVNELLGFRHSCYLVGNYDFVSSVSTGTARNPEMVELKRQIYELFEACFLPEYPSYCCETDMGLNTVLINMPDVRQSPSMEEQLLGCAGAFIRRAESELQVQLKLVLSFCISDLRQLPDAQRETGRLRQLQDAFPHASQILYAGRLEFETEESAVSREELECRLQRHLAALNIPAAHRCVNQLVMQELRADHDMDRLKRNLTRQLEKLHRQMQLTDRRIDILMEAQAALRDVHKIDEVLIILNQYFSSIDLLLRASDTQRQEKQSLASHIHAYVDVHYAEPSLNCSAIAAELKVDENRLSKIFKRQYGIGILAYIQKLRVQRAEQLLTEQDIGISDVARQSGFSSRRTFDRVFRQFTGMTALEYRRDHAKS